MARKNKSFIGGAALGLAVGAVAALYKEQQRRKHPLNTSAQRRLNRALDRALQTARLDHRIQLNDRSRYVIFSDSHRGAGDEADDFMPCKITYQTALDYYYGNGFTLVLLGDIEELWENPIGEVMETHQDVLQSEKRFYPERYLRIIGNHDDAWSDPSIVAAYLEPLYPRIQILPGVVFEYDDDALFGELFLTHGHQGTFDEEFLSGFSPHLLPLYRRMQNKLHIGHTTPATNDYLRGEHDTQMYRWASQKKRLILIAGHTHRPVWSSLTHLDQLYLQLYALRGQQEKMSKAEYREQQQSLLRDIHKRMIKDPPVNDTLKTIPAYFNSGCCRFSDGDITGIEITGQTISLVKWDRTRLQRKEAVSMPLGELFALL